MYPKLYKKAIKGTVGGIYLDKKGNQAEFILKGDPAKKDLEDVSVEIFDADGEKFFIKNNKPAILEGYLIEVSDGVEMTLDAVNAVSDGALQEILKLPFSQLKVRAQQFTSSVPVSRLLKLAMDGNKPYNTVEYLKTLLTSLEKSVPNADMTP